MLRTAILSTLIIAFCITNSSSASIIVVPDDCSSIQMAIDSSKDGDTIIVKPGRYVENIDFHGKAVTVKGCVGPQLTVIDGGSPSNPDHGSVVIFNSGEDHRSKLEGFTLTNGTGFTNGATSSYGGGIYCAQDSSPTISGNIVSGNSAGYWGGGIACVNSSPSIVGNLITSNSAGGVGGGVYCSLSSSLIKNNRIMLNSADNGAGVFSSNGTPIIEDNLISGNATVYWGWGGGIYMSSDGTVVRNDISDNQAGSGGGLCCERSSPVIVGNTIRGNMGGGIFCYYCPLTGFPEIRDNTISYNTDDGGLFCYASDSMVANNMIIGNESQDGGGAGCLFSSPIFINNTISRNYAADRGGGFFVDQSDPIISNTVLWNNQAYTKTEVWLEDSSSLKIDHSDIEGGRSSIYVAYGCTLFWGTNNLDADPLFMEPACGDMHLTWNSPCRNSGCDSAVIPGIPMDFEGDPRIADGRVDMGADEFYWHLYIHGSVVLGRDMELRIVGPPGKAPVRILASSGVRDKPLPTPYGDLCLKVPFHPFDIGAIPENGILRFSGRVPGWWIVESEHPVQALVGPMAPDSRLTNLAVMKVE